eukprot:6202232-Pleurochrysis_carterae.AAC.1
MNITPTPASLNRQCAPCRLHSARSSNVKWTGTWLVDVPPPNAPSLALLARPPACMAAATACLPAPSVETPTCAAAAVTIMHTCASGGVSPCDGRNIPVCM